MRRINVTVANTQANQLNDRARELRALRNSLLSYQSALERNWRGSEMVGINRAIENMLSKLASTATAIDEISSDVRRASMQIQSEEVLAEAQSAVSIAEGRVSQAQNNFNTAQSKYNANTNEAEEVRLRTNLDNVRVSLSIANEELSNARRARDDAQAEVNRWM